MKYIVFILLGVFQLFAIDNRVGKCTNTPFWDLVDNFGCTKKTLPTDAGADIIIGATYSDTNYNTLEKADTLTTTFQADVYHGDLSAQIATSYFKSEGSSTDESGWNDTQLGVYVKIYPSSLLTLQPGFGVVLPTYNSENDNGAVDIFGSLNAQYDLDEHYNIFGGLTYTIVNDKDSRRIIRDNNSSAIISNTPVQYHNTTAFTAGIGYATEDNGFINIAYTQSQSIYTGVEAFKTLSLNGMLPLDKHWFLLGNYRYGLSDSTSDNEIAVRIGYYF